MNTTFAAPRLSASIPIAPVPAKRSANRAPEIFGANTLNNVSRKRSLVGRSARPFKLFRMRLRCVPAMTRMGAVISCQFLVLSQGRTARGKGQWDGQLASGTSQRSYPAEGGRQIQSAGRLVCGCLILVSDTDSFALQTRVTHGLNLPCSP